MLKPSHLWKLLGCLLLATFCLAEEIDDGLLGTDESPSDSYMPIHFPEQDILERPSPPLLKLDILDTQTTVVDTLLPLLGISRQELSMILNLVRVGLGAVEFIEKIFTQVFGSIDGGIENIYPAANAADRKMLAMFNLFSIRLNQIEQGVRGTQATLRNLIRSLPHMVRWEIALNTLEEYTRPINTLYHRFTYYQQNREKVEETTLRDFANSVVSHHSTSIMSLMASIHSMVSPSSPHIPENTEPGPLNTYDVYGKVHTAYMQNYKRHIIALKKRDNEFATGKESIKHLSKLSLRPSVFIMLQAALKEYEPCDLTESEQQIIHGLYTLLIVTQAQGYAMTNYAYMLKRAYGEGNFTLERDVSKELYTHYSKNILKESLNVLNAAQTGHKKCDPKVHREGETFVRVTELLQGYIENEVDLNADGTCRNNCGYYEVAEVKGCYLPDKQYCGKHRRCKGTVHDCQFFDADSWICISEDPFRRYDWVEYEDSTTFGLKKSCNNVMKVDSWWRWFAHCSYCMCKCDDPKSPTTHRFISLMPSVSERSENKVVTGVRFIKQNKVIHIQVQEGTALPQGQVNYDSLRWVTVPPIDVKSSEFKEGVDYQTLNYGVRNFDLDHLKAPKYHVITGVKFRTLGSHMNLEIQVTPVNFTTGEVQFDLSYWFSNDNTPTMQENPRKELKLNKPDIPIKNPLENVIDSKPDMFIALQETTLRSDVSQSTVPYFDAQPVTSTPPTWFSELELYHRGRSGYGGFLGFQMYNYNITSHFVEEQKPIM